MKISQRKVLITFLFYIQFDSCINTTFPGSIQIKRLIPGGARRNWKLVEDSFYIPRSVCDRENGGYDSYCNESCTKDATDDRYSCSCSSDSSTLMYLNNTWRCLENKEVRKQLGCAINTLFRREEKEQSLRTLNAKWERRTTLPRSQSCVVNTNSSWSIQCNGEKVPLDHHTNRTKDIFVLEWKSNAFFIKVIDPLDILKGRVINLGISCSNPDPIEKGCLLFKLEGTVTCPAVPSISSSISPIPTSIKTKLTASLSATLKTTAKPLETVTVSTQVPRTSIQPGIGRKQKNDDVSSSSSNSLGIIAGVTVSMTLVLLLIAAVLIYRRRKSRKEANSSTSGKINENSRNSKTNSALQLEEQDRYVMNIMNNDEEPFGEGYTENYDAPQKHAEHRALRNQNTRSPEETSQYASLKISEGHYIYGPGSAQEPVYNVLQDPNEMYQTHGTLSAGQPVYNVLEDISGEHIGKCAHNAPNQPEPLYNVLEGPYGEGSAGPAWFGSVPDGDPFYNALEGPDQNVDSPHVNEPVYNVLEAPYLSGVGEEDRYGPTGVQDTVYNVLEGPDPSADSWGSNNVPV